MQGPATLPACITVNRAEGLTGNQIIANRFVLYDRLTDLALRAVRTYVATDDAPSVAQAISELMIKQAETTDSLVEVLARRLPILHHVGVEWPYMAVCPVAVLLMLPLLLTVAAGYDPPRPSIVVMVA